MVLHEVLESYTAMNIGIGIHTAETTEGDATYTEAHTAVNKMPASNTSEAGKNVHIDIGRAIPGYNLYWHESPKNGNREELFRVKQ